MNNFGGFLTLRWQYGICRRHLVIPNFCQRVHLGGGVQPLAAKTVGMTNLSHHDTL